MEKLVGPKVRAIGVSNFTVANLEKLAKTQKIVPAANQVNTIFFFRSTLIMMQNKTHMAS
jgi:diketogulonate reductase-like aldo/keto reductase